MHVTELDSFVQKFQQLWKAGITAHLDLDTHAGYAWVGLRAQLGHAPPGPFYQHVPHTQRRHRGPSYRRRQQKRQAVRSTADNAAPAEEASNKVSTMENSVAVEATTSKEIEEENTAEIVEENIQESSHEQSIEKVAVKVTVQGEVNSDLECPLLGIF